MKDYLKKALLFCAFILAKGAFATAYPVPTENQALIGNLVYTTIGFNDNIVDLAKKYDIGYNSLEHANPHLNLAHPLHMGYNLQIPTQHLLPDLPRKGIVVNLPEMRMYYYTKDAVYTYPIGIGKIGKTLPVAQAVITRKVRDPSWAPTPDIRVFDLRELGIVLPTIMPPGPDNPLGSYAIYMSIPTFLIHSTIFPESIGKRASFGCVRLYEKDIQDFFPTVEKGVPVVVVNAPVKLGWHENAFYMEVHQPLEESGVESDVKLPHMVEMIMKEEKKTKMLIDWQRVAYMAAEKDGIPHPIGIKISKK